MSNYTALINNIKRSEAAYRVYIKKPIYHHAVHIFYANELVYEELNSLLKEHNIDKNIQEAIFSYLFHLEDWFLQFSTLEKEVSDVEQNFSFLPLKNSIPYPSGFLEIITK